MLYPLKIICKKEWTKQDGATTLFIQYCLNSSQRTLLNTDIAIPSNYWNAGSKRINAALPTEWGNANHLNHELARMLRLAEDILTFCINHTDENPLKFLKGTFNPELDLSLLERRKAIVSSLDIYVQFDEFLEIKRKRIAPATVHIYGEVKKYLQAFENFRGRNITFKSFDFDFYEAFVEFLTYDYESYRYKRNPGKGLKINTIGKAIKHLKLFLKDRMKRKIIPEIDLSDYKVIEELADATYLDTEEIETIYKMDLSQDPKLDVFRDLVILGCQTGLRFSDFSTIKPEDTRKGKLYVKQQKSQHWVVIPLRPLAFEVLVNKLKGNVPKFSNGGFNEAIKEVCKKAELTDLIKFSYKKGNRMIEEVRPKYAWITSHTCRDHFARMNSWQIRLWS
ncbi:MAG: site-specific integrase [Sphingobacteriales bacterium]|nr:MAG: site-specific integrase [Sphingobacteriales bacterium]